PSQFVAYADDFAEMVEGPFHGAIHLQTIRRGELVLQMGCSKEDEQFCLVVHPLSGKAGYIYVPTEPRPTRTFDFSAIAEGRGTMTGNDKLRVLALRALQTGWEKSPAARAFASKPAKAIFAM